MEVNVQIRRIAKDLPLPAYQSELAAGVDLMAAEDVKIQPGESAIVPSGVAVALPEGYEAQIRPRSGLAARHQISVVNTPGTIDSDYRGEIKIILINHGKQPFRVRRGERIAQMVPNQVPRMVFSEVDELPESGRGEGGLGSTKR